jgi:hypothetical protein
MTHFPFGTVSARTAAYLIEQSLLFDGAAYLSRTPSVTGNRKTWTFSCWVKRGSLGSYQTIFIGGPNGTATLLQFKDDDTLDFYEYSSSTRQWGYNTSAAFRDTSSWYHIVCQLDTPNETGGIWVNGVELTYQSSSNPALNRDCQVNNTVQQSIGYQNTGNEFEGLMALPILVDGAALDPTSFGEEDADGYWNPIAYVTGAEPAAIGATWRGSYSSDSDAASYTNSGAALGTADADRYVIVAIPLFTGVSNLTISSVTIGGVSATKINGETFYSATSTNRSLVDFWKANVPTGTTGDIVITPSTTAPRMSASWWTCIGDVAIIDTQADIATNVTPDNSLTVTSKRPSNGFVLAAITGQGDSGDPTFTWGGTGITEKHETGYGDTDGAHGSASGDFTAASTEAITVTNGLGDMYYYILSAVTFAPPGGDGAYGTNGGAYDFADSGYFGKDASVVDASATVISASGEWTVGTASITFSGDGWTYNATDDALYVTDTFAVASWPMSYQLALNGSVDNPGAAIGLFDNAEIGTFNHQNNSGGLDAMTASWRFRPSDGVLWYGATTVATLGARSINDILKFIVDADGTVRFFINEVLRHTFAQSATGKTLRLMSACSNTTSYDGCKWVTNIPGNSFTDSGFATTDQLADTPTDDVNLGIGNYCTWSDSCANGGAAFTLSEANTKIQNAAGQDAGWWANIFPTSGKWYFETTLGAVSTGNPSIGVVSQSVANSNDTYDINTGNGFDFGGSGEAYAYHAGGDKISDAASVAYGSSYTTNDIIGVAVDLDNHAIWFSKNGTWQASATTGEIAAGTTTNAAFTGLTTGEGFSPFCHNGSINVIWTLNCGQKAFAYTPPTGFVALATQNLPATHPLYTGTAAQYRAGTQVQSDALGSDSIGGANQSMRVVIPASAIADQSATRVRLKLKAASSQAFDTSHLYFGTNATGGSNAWDFTGDQVQVSVNGSTTISVAAGTSVYSDWFTFACDGTDPLCAAWLFAATGGGTAYAATSGYTRYYKVSGTSSTDASATSPSGFTAQSNYFMLIAAIEVQ